MHIWKLLTKRHALQSRQDLNERFWFRVRWVVLPAGAFISLIAFSNSEPWWWYLTFMILIVAIPFLGAAVDSFRLSRGWTDKPEAT
jgi:hypothetical protein